MTVHFIGAGPGAADLITVRGLNLIKSCPVVLYAGSLVPEAVIAEAAAAATVVDTAPLDLDAIIALMIEADAKGQDVARVHSGDPSLYGAISEQIRRLDGHGIAWTITPGVPGVRCGRSRARPGIHAARHRPERRPHPHRRPRLGHARGRDAGSLRPRRAPRSPSTSRSTTSPTSAAASSRSSAPTPRWSSSTG